MSNRRRDRKKAAAQEQALLDQLEAQREEIQHLKETSQPRITPVYIRKRSSKKCSNAPEYPPIAEWLGSEQTVTRGRSPQDVVEPGIEPQQGRAAPAVAAGDKRLEKEGDTESDTVGELGEKDKGNESCDGKWSDDKGTLPEIGG